MDLGIEHRQHKGLNNQAENSHVLDEAERKENAKVQISQTSSEILSAAELIYQQTQPARHKLMAATTRAKMIEGIKSWKQITKILVSIPA
jgi:putative transposase